MLLLAHGDTVPVDELSGAWRGDPLPIAAATLGLALFAQAWLRLRSRGRADLASGGRAALYGAGVALITLALVSPLDALGDEYLLSAHMLEHLAIGDLGPALVLVALRGPLTFFLLPTPVLRTLAPLRPLRALLGFLLRPKVAFALWTASIAAWHVPVGYEAALHHDWVHQLEHACFLVTGFLVWAQLVDPARRRELRVPAGRVLYAILLFGVSHVVVHPLLFGGGVVYSTYAHQDERLLGLSALADQHWAGILMTIEQVLTLGTASLVVLWPRLNRAAEAAPPGQPTGVPRE